MLRKAGEQSYTYYKGYCVILIFLIIIVIIVTIASITYHRHDEWIESFLWRRTRYCGGGRLRPGVLSLLDLKDGMWQWKYLIVLYPAQLFLSLLLDLARARPILRHSSFHFPSSAFKPASVCLLLWCCVRSVKWVKWAYTMNVAWAKMSRWRSKRCIIEWMDGISFQDAFVCPAKHDMTIWEKIVLFCPGLLVSRMWAKCIGFVLLCLRHCHYNTALGSPPARKFPNVFYYMNEQERCHVPAPWTQVLLYDWVGCLNKL